MGANIWQSFRHITKCAFQVLGSARSRVGTGCQFFFISNFAQFKTRDCFVHQEEKSFKRQI